MPSIKWLKIRRKKTGRWQGQPSIFSSFWCILFIPCTLLRGPSILTYARSLTRPNISKTGIFRNGVVSVERIIPFPWLEPSLDFKNKRAKCCSCFGDKQVPEENFWEISPRLLLFFGIINKYFVVSLEEVVRGIQMLVLCYNLWFHGNGLQNVEIFSKLAW